MSPESVVTFGRHGLEILLTVAAPLLIVGLLVGLAVSVLQAVTQINEATLSFLPKLLALSLTMVIAGPWILSVLTDYLRQVLGDIANLTFLY
ncbi:MAG: flagellar biosynthesis protein FliQ [Burkholderiaceae bacterium]